MQEYWRKREKVINNVHRTANYLRFLAFLVSGSYAPVVLMPHLLRCFFCKQLGRCPSMNCALSRKERGFKMVIGKAGSILAPALFVLNLPVALTRAPGKIIIRQRLQHMCGISHTQMAGTKTQRSVSSVFQLQKSHIGVQTDLAKKRKRKKSYLLVPKRANCRFQYITGYAIMRMGIILILVYFLDPICTLPKYRVPVCKNYQNQYALGPKEEVQSK